MLYFNIELAKSINLITAWSALEFGLKHYIIKIWPRHAAVVVKQQNVFNQFISYTGSPLVGRDTFLIPVLLSLLTIMLTLIPEVKFKINCTSPLQIYFLFLSSWFHSLLLGLVQRDHWGFHGTLLTVSSLIEVDLQLQHFLLRNCTGLGSVHQY